MGTELPVQGNSSDKTIAMVVYGLQAASFIIPFASIVGVIVNYVKRSDVRGTLLESHFKWQIRTFWWSLLWGIIGYITLIVYIGFAILLLLAVWYIYRIVRGFLRLNDGRAMYKAGDFQPD